MAGVPSNHIWVSKSKGKGSLFLIIFNLSLRNILEGDIGYWIVSGR